MKLMLKSMKSLKFNLEVLSNRGKNLIEKKHKDVNLYNQFEKGHYTYRCLTKLKIKLKA